MQNSDAEQYARGSEALANTVPFFATGPALSLFAYLFLHF